MVVKQVADWIVKGPCAYSSKLESYSESCRCKVQAQVIYASYLQRILL